MSSIATYTQERMVKAARTSRGLRTLDATFSRTAGGLRTMAQRGISLIAGREMAGFAIGINGVATREVASTPDEMLALLGTNEVVYACLRERMKVLIQPTFVVERRAADGAYVVEDDHPLAALFRRPGPNLDTASLWRCLEASYASVGQLYLEPLFANGVLQAVNPLNPAFVVEEYDAGRLTGYRWQPPEGAGYVFAPNELITRRSVSWADVPPLQAALGSVEADRLSNEFLSGFFAGGGIPTAVIKVKGALSQERSDTMRQRWLEIFFPGSRLPAFLDENIESYQRVGVSLNELDNETLRMFIETRICMCFGVPPLVIYAYAGLLKATYSNLQEAWASFWDATALPLLKEWAEWVTWALLTFYEDPDDVKAGAVRVRFDVSQIGPYQEDVNGKIERFKDGYAGGAVKLNEYRAVLGLQADPDGDVYKAPPQPPVPWTLPPSNPQPADALPTEGKAIVVRQQKAAPAVPVRLDRDVARYLRDQYALARRLWLQGNDAGADAVLATIADELDDGIALFGILAPSERKVYADSWRAAAGRIEQNVVLDSGDVTAAVDILARRCVGITETTRQEIADVIMQGAREQWSDAEIAAKLGQLSIDRAAARAPAITRTELAVASSTAATDAYKASGVVGSLEWLNGSDPCPECLARNGKQYDLTSDLPELPAHPNCTCDWAPVLAPVLEVAS
jgi:phage portal protein BeeE